MLFQHNSFCVFILLVSVFSCTSKKENEEISSKKDPAENFTLNIPAHFPSLKIPSDNLLTIERVELGEKLFFDTRLSIDSTISCGSCHKPELAFADSIRISPGVNGKFGFRNAPSLLNVGYRTSFMLDGGIPTLEIQVVHPLTDTNEMGFGINEAVDRLKMDKEYQKAARNTYNRDFDAYVLTRALSAFERTLISRTSFDDVAENKMYFPVEVENGKNLFYSDRLNCDRCHSTSLFSDFTFQNNGSKENYDSDPGRERITHKKEDIGKFKVPSLRGLKYTAPYMHDGSFKTLKDVIDHYSKGGSSHPNKSDHVKPFTLTDKEKNDLIQFLECL